jgi:hypothetical protein
MPISCVGGEAAAGTRVYRRVLYILKIDIQGSTTNMMRNVPEMLLNRANISPVPEPLQQSNISLTRPGSEMPSRHIHESGMTRGGRSTLKVSQASPQSIHDRKPSNLLFRSATLFDFRIPNAASEMGLLFQMPSRHAALHSSAQTEGTSLKAKVSPHPAMQCNQNNRESHIQVQG